MGKAKPLLITMGKTRNQCQMGLNSFSVLRPVDTAGRGAPCTCTSMHTGSGSNQGTMVTSLAAFDVVTLLWVTAEVAQPPAGGHFTSGSPMGGFAT